MSHTPLKVQSDNSEEFETPSKKKSARAKTLSLKAIENVCTQEDQQQHELPQTPTRRSGRKVSPSKRYLKDFETPSKKRAAARRELDDGRTDEDDSEFELEMENENVPTKDAQLFDAEMDVEGKRMFCFNTPKKRDGMALAAMNTPKAPKTPRLGMKTPDTKRKKQDLGPKTPRHVRSKVKKEISKLITDSNSDFSADESDFQPSDSDEEESSSSSEETAQDSEEPESDSKSRRTRRSIVVPILPKTPSTRRRGANKKNSDEFVPESDGYFQSHSSTKILTSDHTLDRLKNPRLQADRLFSLLATMKLSSPHEEAITGMLDEYKSQFTKWLYILNEGYNILLFGLGSKRNLLQSFHREMLSNQTVLVVNGFFPSLTIKDILDNITNDILDLTSCPGNLHEIVNVIEEEFSLISETHLFLIVHNIDGAMLRNSKAQEILCRLAKVPNIHLLASIDHINTPLLWDHTKLNNFNFSWWDVTTMLPYTDETAFENSLLVQNSGELALSSMRSVFQSLTQNARGIYMIIVKHQLSNKGNHNYQGMPFKDLYWGCREAFLVSSDLALRAQLTEFLDHKLVKSKRSVDGSEQLTIPIDSGLLQQFLDEQQQ